ncbi:MAG: hypothetical protein Q9181_006544 [Wetmoreana brouardii]
MAENYCAYHGRQFVNYNAYADHMTKHNYHVWCRKCDRDFVHYNARKHHYEDHLNHLFTYCDDCEIDFADEEGLNYHKQYNSNHHWCKQCDEDFDSNASLIQHWKFHTKHRKTFCVVCSINFANFDALKKHWTSDGKHKYTYCVDCELNFPDHGRLRQHWASTTEHRNNYDRVCEIKFATSKECSDHVFADPKKHFSCHLDEHKSEQLRCFSGCDDSKQFTSVASVIEHLQSGTCTKGWTIQHLNSIAAEHADIFKFLDQHYLPWFLAGPPRDVVNEKDFATFVWKCPLCKTSLLSRSDLAQHLKEQGCHMPYPKLLTCSDCKLTFTKLSELIYHAFDNKTRDCRNVSVLKDIARYVMTKVAQSGGQAKPLQVLHQLRVDTTPQKDLIIKVTMNPTVHINGSR